MPDKAKISKKVTEEVKNIMMAVENNVPGGVYLYNILVHYRSERYIVRFLVNDKVVTNLILRAINEDIDGGEFVDEIRRMNRLANLFIYRFAKSYSYVFQYILENDNASDWVVDQIVSMVDYLNVWFDGRSDAIKLLLTEEGMDWLQRNVLLMVYRLYILSME